MVNEDIQSENVTGLMKEIVHLKQLNSELEEKLEKERKSHRQLESKLDETVRFHFICLFDSHFLDDAFSS